MGREVIFLFDRLENGGSKGLRNLIRFTQLLIWEVKLGCLVPRCPQPNDAWEFSGQLVILDSNSLELSSLKIKKIKVLSGPYSHSDSLFSFLTGKLSPYMEKQSWEQRCIQFPVAGGIYGSPAGGFSELLVNR